MPLKDKVLLKVTEDGREYYLCPPTKVKPPDKNHPEPWQEHPKPWIGWRIPDIREGFRAKPGYKFVGADYSQIEVRIMAFLSKDAWLISALNSGKDIHCYTATDVYGTKQVPPVSYDQIYYAYKHEEDPNHKLYTKWRADVKTTTFGVPYGAGPNRVSAMTGLTHDEAVKLIADFFKNAWQLKKWLDEQEAQALHYGFTKSLRGRKRFYRRPDQRKELDPRRTPQEREEAKKKRQEIESQIRRWAGNQPIQTSCVDLLKPAMVKFYLALRNGDWKAKPLWDTHVVLSIHDEIISQCLEAGAEEIKALLEKCMQEVYEEIIFGIKNKVDANIADYWKK